MHIGIDIDGTITRHPAFFAQLASGFRAAGHRVTIVTFRTDRAAAEADLAAMRVPYDVLVVFEPERCSLPSLDTWKGSVCAALGIDLLFDDHPETLNHLPATTLGLMIVDPTQGLVGYD